MIQTFTLNDLICYAFNEKKFPDDASIRYFIDNDPVTGEIYDGFVSSINYLDSIIVEPSPRCIDNLLEYSRSHKNQSY
jgi:hypothetical protein